MIKGRLNVFKVSNKLLAIIDNQFLFFFFIVIFQNFIKINKFQ